MEDWEMYCMDLPEEKLARAIKENKEGRLKCSEERYREIVGKQRISNNRPKFRPKRCFVCRQITDDKYCSIFCENMGSLRRLRELIRKEDKCSICSVKKSGNGKSLHIHHVDENQNNNKPENLLLVCAKCHSHLHMKHKWVSLVVLEAKIKGHKFVVKN